MIFVRRRTPSEHWSNYGCVDANIDVLTGSTDAVIEQYLEYANNVFPSVAGASPWVLVSRTGIEATAGYPDWSALAARYWSNLYYRPQPADFMRGRFVVFEPELWVRTGSGAFRTNPCATPNCFGRNSTGDPIVADVDNTWRRDIRLNLDRLLTNDVGSTGGEPYITQTKYTNYKSMLILGPNEIDKWENARIYYVADDEVSTQTNNLPIFDEYNIDSRLSGNILPRLQQEGYSGFSTGWTGAGAIASLQNVNVVSEGDGLRVTFADYAGSFAIQAGGSLTIGAIANLTLSLYMRSVSGADLTGVRIQLDWGTATAYISSSSAVFTVNGTTMTQYSLTAARPGTATRVSVLIMRDSAGGAVDCDFICLRESATLPVPSSVSQARQGAWTKVLDDDFDTFDTTNWTKAVEFGWTDFYGEGIWNDSLVTVANSRLRMTTQLINGVWNSGLVLSKGKREYTYGYFEARMKLSAGMGMFPAWWLFPVAETYGQWPRSGELDIMEHPGGIELQTVGSTIHWWGSNDHQLKAVIADKIDWSADFHVFGVLWEKSTDNRVIVRWFVDNAPYGMYDQSEWDIAPGGTAGSPFDHPYFMILNLGVGGGWAGPPIPASSGSYIEVDWVRVWQRAVS